MEHEVHVPFAVGAVRSALADAERTLRCVPGLTLDAEANGQLGGTSASAAADPTDTLGTSAPDGTGADQAAVRGRLRVRVGGATITYRGALRLAVERDGFAVEAEGTEARGAGGARLRLTVRPTAGAGNEGATHTVLRFTGTVSGEGRITELEEKQLRATGRRILDRFATALSDSLAVDPSADDNTPAIPGVPAPDSHAEPRDQPQLPDPSEPDSPADRGQEPIEPTAVQDEDSGLSVFETEIPPSSLDPDNDEDAEVAEELAATDVDPEPGEPSSPAGAAIPAPGSPPAEAAHARRTMIGRSAEEVDHAPPRGRYAPEPALEPGTSGLALRWAAPAAALAIASAVVVSRVVRRRSR